MNVVEFDLARFGGVRALSLQKHGPDGYETITTAASVPSVPRDRGIVYSRNEETKSESQGEVSKTIECARDTGDTGDRRQRPMAPSPPPKFRFASDGMDFGDICAGWPPASWAHELRRKADRCHVLRPDIADYFRRWVRDIEAKLEAP